jgi:hypothetical protein
MESRQTTPPGCLTVSMLVLLIWGLAGWALVFRPQIFSRWIQPAPTTTVVAPTAPSGPAPRGAAVAPAGSGFFVAVDGGILSVWKIGEDGKPTRVAYQPVLTPEEQGKLLAGTAAKATEAYKAAAGEAVSTDVGN